MREGAPSPNAGGGDPSPVPAWVHRLGVAVWVSDPDRVVSYVNDRARDLLGLDAVVCLGAPCCRAIGGRDREGRPVCSPRCPVAAAAARGEPLAPVDLRTATATARWIEVLPIAVWEPDGRGPWLVHCAFPRERERRLEAYLARVADRSAACGPRGSPATLTRREREVLEHLARDEELPAIARALHVSHVTVRNHVQHILSKLGAHSILEAIALRLLHDDV